MGTLHGSEASSDVRHEDVLTRRLPVMEVTLINSFCNIV